MRSISIWHLCESAATAAVPRAPESAPRESPFANEDCLLSLYSRCPRMRSSQALKRQHEDEEDEAQVRRAFHRSRVHSAHSCSSQLAHLSPPPVGPSAAPAFSSSLLQAGLLVSHLTPHLDSPCRVPSRPSLARLRSATQSSLRRSATAPRARTATASVRPTAPPFALLSSFHALPGCRRVSEPLFASRAITLRTARHQRKLPRRRAALASGSAAARFAHQARNSVSLSPPLPQTTTGHAAPSSRSSARSSTPPMSSSRYCGSSPLPCPALPSHPRAHPFS